MAQEKSIRPYGLWPSPITPAHLLGRSPFGDVQWTLDGNGLVWLDSRGGGGQLYYLPLGGARRELLGDLTARGGIGYGGGEFGLSKDSVFFAERSGTVFRRNLEQGFSQPITPAFGMIAAPVPVADGDRVFYIHSDGQNDVLAMADGTGDMWPVKLVSGADFYMWPTCNADGSQLAWVEWDHPNMPWDGTRLMIGTLGGNPPRVKKARVIAGGHGENITQPRFSPDGKFLSYLVGRGDWHVLEVFNLETAERKIWLAGDFDLSTPSWTQGNHSYGWSPFGNRIFILTYTDGLASLCSVDAAGTVQTIPTEPYTWLDQLSVSPVNDEFALIASSPRIPWQVIRWDNHRWRPVAFSDRGELNPDDFSNPQPVEWEAQDEKTIHGIYFPPANRHFTGTGAPPLIIHIHGGPTSQAVVEYPREAQYFTSRGFAWLAVNYRGSSGYGRAYQDALRGNWGVLDTADAVSAVQAMAVRGLGDKDRMIIMGGSAGGFTVLNALIQAPGVFKAGIALYPVCNLFTLAAETTKFEQHYLDGLLGTLPAAAAAYHARSPLFQADKIKDPVAIFHGSADQAVPLSQSQAIVDRLRASGTPHLYQVYPGEGHGFRMPETLADLYPRIEKFLLEHVLFT